jgi:uncharacterized protein YndB with AHSA1/START domain
MIHRLRSEIVQGACLLFLALFLSLALEVFMTESTIAQETAAPPTPQFFLVELHGIRAGWPNNMTADEERIMGEHFTYLKGLTAKGTVLMAGPVDMKWGLIVFRVYSEAELHEIMDKEPSVVQKVHTYEFSPMVVALLADYTPRYRYPETITDREIYKEVTVKGSLDDVWRAWTTNEGANEFFSPHTNIQCRTGGPYEIYFSGPGEAPRGERGSEGCKVLSFLPKSMLSFEWNAPPKFGPLRDIHTRVVIDFEPVRADSVRVRFHHLGWGADPGWNEIYDYFDKAWGFVMANFQKRFETGPLKWDE